MEITREWAKMAFRDKRSSGFTVQSILSWAEEWEKVRNEVLRNARRLNNDK
jgi:hypothetical protein